LDNVAVTTQKLKDQVTKDLADTLNQLATIKTNYFDEINKIRDQVDNLNTTFTNNLTNSNNELKTGYESKINALNDKLVESMSNINTIQNDQQKIIEATKVQSQQSEQKLGVLQNVVDEHVQAHTTFKVEINDKITEKITELKTVNDTKFHMITTESNARLTELKTTQDSKYQEYLSDKSLAKEENKTNFNIITTDNSTKYVELSDKINNILKIISGQATEMKGYMNILESNVNDLESKVFPNGKEVIRH
jgi:hypothetical protein